MRRSARKSKTSNGNNIGLRDLFGNPSAVTTILTERGSFLSTNTLTSGAAATFNVNPGLVGRLSTVSTVFELYRFRSLKVEFLPPVTGSYGAIVAGFQTSAPGTSPTTYGQISELPNVAIGWQGQTIPSMLTIDARQFNQFEYKWLPVDGTLGSHGKLFFITAASATAPLFIRFQYEVEFAQPVSTGYFAPRQMVPVQSPPNSWEELADEDDEKSPVSESVSVPISRPESSNSQQLVPAGPTKTVSSFAYLLRRR